MEYWEGSSAAWTTCVFLLGIRCRTTYELCPAQQRRDLLMLQQLRTRESSVSGAVAYFGVCASREQKLDHFCVISFCSCPDQWSSPRKIGNIWIGLPVQQQLDCFFGTSLYGCSERSCTVRLPYIYARASIEQENSNLHALAACSVMQGFSTCLGVFDIRIGSSREQHVRSVATAVLRCRMQRRSSVSGEQIDLGLMIEKQRQNAAEIQSRGAMK